MSKNRFSSLDGLKTVACIGIIMMHIHANGNYNLSGFFFDRIIPSFTDFVYLFMAISAFGLCCGYYEKYLNKSIDWGVFYSKRYLKIVPFFALLILMDLTMNFGIDSLCEAFAEILLMHGFIPYSLNVIGVAWFLGVVFVFYFLFPFFCSLLSNRYTRWIAFLLSIVLNYVLLLHFGLGRSNFLFCFCYFLLGGIVYIYREKISIISKKYKWMILICTLCEYFLYLFYTNTISTIFLVLLLLMLALGESKLLSNRITIFISGISFEMYLSHMVFYRIAERTALNSVLGNGVAQYFITFILVLFGTVLFSFFMNRLLSIVMKKCLRISL